ncbi:heavy-metal-associated domain-containing protein [Diaphorobacter aerolatus]|uniref:Heavy-metal-associated domain-containing protein n=1 Tax=Diaphorobacter aerolatus TaxID=1288495 RepID=A0A7H0GGG9_9BURK|nr:heavy-metal-associated domain-containing protein [Diaphorobacter aerolatus]QNP47385.1 heavy-metal-associated domain-containing protein [Diaphorobacter aerolatus]
MTTFKVQGMTCGGCAGRIERAIAAQDPGARVQIDLRERLVQVDSALPADALTDTLKAAGYDAQAVESTA